MSFEQHRQAKFNLYPNMKAISKTVQNKYVSLLSALIEKTHNSGMNISQRELDMIVQKEMDELKEQLETVVYDSIDDAYKQGQSQITHALFESMTDSEAKQMIGGSLPDNWQGTIPSANYLRQSNNLFTQLAEHKLRYQGLSKYKAMQIVSNQESDRYVRALFEDTYTDILLATQNTQASTKKVVREIVSDTLQYHSLRDSNSSSMADELYKRLSKKGLSERIIDDGFVGIVDRSGRKWDLETYSNMVSKTKVEQAYREGEQQLAKEFGVDLGVISSHGATDACANWEGVVVSMNGETEGYPSLEDVVGTNEVFHPNCEHNVHPIRSLDQLPQHLIDKHMQKIERVKNPENRQYKRKS